MKHLIEQKIVEMLSESVTHPYHAHVTSVANYGTGKEDNLVTGFGKSKHESEHTANVTNKIYHEIDDDEEVHGLHKNDVHFRVSEKAHDHLKSHGHDMNTGEGRDGYEHIYPDDHEHLHFDWKKKTISHKSEVNHK